MNAGNAEETKRLLSTSSLNFTHNEGFFKELVVSAIDSKSLSVLKCIFDKFAELLQSEYQMSYEDCVKDNCSLLHHAAAVGAKEIVEFLVQSGLDVKQRTSEHERTVLGFAASGGHLNVVNYLLNIYSTEDMRSLGADPIVRTGVGGSVEIFNGLVNIGFDPMQKNKYGDTSLHLALKTGKKELALYIMEQYPELIHMTGRCNRSVLHCAAFGGSVALLKHLIDRGEDIFCVDKEGATILHMACSTGKRDAVMYLTKNYKALLLIKDNDGKTALHYASEGGNVDIFKHLVAAGLSVLDCTKDGGNMLHSACLDRNFEMIEYLLQNYGDNMIQPTIQTGWYPFHDAARFGDEPVIRLFIKHNIDICKLTSKGESILHISCLHANIDTARFILTQFPQLIPMKNNYDKTALELAAIGHRADDIVKLLKDK